MSNKIAEAGITAAGTAFYLYLLNKSGDIVGGVRDTCTTALNNTIDADIAFLQEKQRVQSASSAHTSHHTTQNYTDRIQAHQLVKRYNLAAWGLATPVLEVLGPMAVVLGLSWGAGKVVKKIAKSLIRPS